VIPTSPNTPTDPTTQGTMDALAEFDIMHPIAAPEPTDPIISSRVDFGWVSLTQATATGRRKQNEDFTDHAMIGDCLVVVLADGMGGHQAGREAAELAVRGVLSLLTSRKKSLANAEHETHLAARLLDDAVRRASHSVAGLADRVGHGRAPGCTLLIALVYRQKFIVRHIGDSRALWANERSCWELTQPHHIGHSLTSAIPDPKQQDTFVRSVPYDQNVALALFSDGITQPFKPECGSGLRLHVSDYGMQNLATARLYVVEQLALADPYQDNTTAVVIRW